MRMPSGWCGVVGLKPTYGRVSRAGVFPLGASLDHVGPMTRRVADAAAMLDVMAGFDPDDPTTLREPPPRCADAIGGDVRGVRVGWDARFASAGAQPELVATVQRAVQDLAASGAEIVEVHLPAVEPILPAWPVLCAGEAAAAHAKTYPSRAADYGPTFRSFLEYAATLRAQDYAAAHEARINWAGELRGVFERVDVLACPSTFMAAPPAELIDPHGPFTPDIAPFMRFTAPFNFSGSPTLSMPCGFSTDGLPYSLQLVARHGDEAPLPLIPLRAIRVAPYGGRRRNGRETLAYARARDELHARRYAAMREVQLPRVTKQEWRAGVRLPTPLRCKRSSRRYPSCC
jgi:amidase